MLPFEKYQIRFEDIAGALSQYRIIDVRSPGEFAEDRIPGAVNLPVLDDQERAEVGTLYKKSQFEARELGARYISANISRHLLAVGDLERRARKPFLVYCWRGGMRSRALFTVMHMIGYQVKLLSGGYQSYRRSVQAALYEAPLRARAIVVHGYTGSAKTAALRQLKAEGAAVVDLEGAANHRGSLLGSLPGGQPAQKDFESSIFQDLPLSGSFLIEGESRKIGRLSIPPSLWSAMTSGIHVWVQVPLEARAGQCVADYGNDLERLEQGLGLITGISRQSRERIAEDLHADRLMAAARVLLEDYYDPLYRRHGPEHQPERYSAMISVEHPADLANSLREKFTNKEVVWTQQH